MPRVTRTSTWFAQNPWGDKSLTPKENHQQSSLWLLRQGVLSTLQSIETHGGNLKFDFPHPFLIEPCLSTCTYPCGHLLTEVEVEWISDLLLGKMSNMWIDFALGCDFESVPSKTLGESFSAGYPRIGWRGDTHDEERFSNWSFDVVQGWDEGLRRRVFAVNINTAVLPNYTPVVPHSGGVLESGGEVSESGGDGFQSGGGSQSGGGLESVAEGPESGGVEGSQSGGRSL